MTKKSVRKNMPRLADPIRDFAYKTLSESGDVSAAHNPKHLSRVGEGAYGFVTAFHEMAIVGGFTYYSLRDVMSPIISDNPPVFFLELNRQAESSRGGGYLHDVVRAASEDTKNGIDDETASAMKSEPMLTGLVERGVLRQEEKDAILASIHTSTAIGDAELLKNPLKDAPVWFLENPTRLIRLGVFIADKCDANGSFVSIRRSQFVGGERLHKKTGDLFLLHEKVKDVPELAKWLTPEGVIALESYIRLGVKNNPNVYPAWTRPVVDGLFKQQQDFVYPLLASMGITEEDIANAIKTFAGKGMDYPGITLKQVDAYESTRDKAASLRRIGEVTEEQKASAKDLVAYCSATERMYSDTDELTRSYRSDLPSASKWRAQAIEQLDKGIDWYNGLLRA